MHTKGPWEWVHEQESSMLVHFTGEKFPNGEPAYIRIHTDGSAFGEYGPDIDPHGEDARLIAAAPDLLAALEKLLSVYVEAVNPTCPFSEAAQAEHAARIAIARATAASPAGVK